MRKTYLSRSCIERCMRTSGLYIYIDRVNGTGRDLETVRKVVVSLGLVMEVAGDVSRGG